MKIFIRLYLILPLLIINFWTETRVDNEEVAQAAKQNTHLILSSIALIIFFLLSEKVVDSILKRRKSTAVEVNAVSSVNGAAAVSMIWLMLIFLFAYDFLRSRTSYGIWSNGVVKSLSLLESVSSENLVEIKKEVQNSAQESEKNIMNETVILFTRKLNQQTDTVITCLENCRKQKSP